MSSLVSIYISKTIITRLASIHDVCKSFSFIAFLFGHFKWQKKMVFLCFKFQNCYVMNEWMNECDIYCNHRYGSFSRFSLILYNIFKVCLYVYCWCAWMLCVDKKKIHNIHNRMMIVYVFIFFVIFYRFFLSLQKENINHTQTVHYQNDDDDHDGRNWNIKIRNIFFLVPPTFFWWWWWDQFSQRIFLCLLSTSLFENYWFQVSSYYLSNGTEKQNKKKIHTIYRFCTQRKIQSSGSSSW